VQAASSAASCEDQASGHPYLAGLPKRLSGRCPGAAISDLVVVLADADDVGDVVVFLFLISQEGIVVVIAEIDVFLVLDLRQIVGLGVFIGLFERNDLGSILLGVDFLFFHLDLVLDDLVGAGLEVGPRIRLTRIR
jgi:hypothetical protein